MDENTVLIQDPFTLEERVYSFCGIWPLKQAAIKKDIATDRFNDTEETSMYFGYNHLSITFTNVAISGGLTVATLLYISPLKQLIHFDSICLIVTLILHVCGRLSILSHRIRNITVKDKRQWHDAIRRVVKTHLKLIWMAKSINDVFHLVLLIELTVSCIRLSLYTYVLITHMQISDLTIIFTFIIYVTMMLLILFAYCFTGEQLIQESKNLQAAYYHCNWEQMPKGCRTSLLICMIYAQKSYYLTAGKFYIFSLYGFTDVVKTSMAYVSMLQSFT
ncbi:hypothetical protein KM043_013448 [Ampulex compressa]|nr:hypothetical protein KM043_013448 [Ampulex compressa]